jgi:hypothetical protein
MANILPLRGNSATIIRSHAHPSRRALAFARLRIRQSFDDVTASGEGTLVTGGDANAIAV